MSKYILSIVSIVFIGYFVEILAIDNSFKKYINTTVGIIIILTLIQPLRSIKDLKLENFFENSVSQIESYEFSGDITQNNVLIIFNKKLEKDIVKHMADTYSMKVSCKVKTHISGEDVKIDSVSIVGVPNEKQGLVYNILSQRYGIEKSQITVSYGNYSNLT